MHNACHTRQTQSEERAAGVVGFQVEAAVTRRSPHRSVRKAFPYTVPQ